MLFNKLLFIACVTRFLKVLQNTLSPGNRSIDSVKDTILSSTTCTISVVFHIVSIVSDN